MNQSKYVYNNEAFGVVAIASTLRHAQTLSLSKALLILPLFSHKETLDYLKRSNSDVKSIEQLIAKKGNVVSNFHKRYESLLPVSINSILILCEMKIAKYENQQLVLINHSRFNFNDSGLGNRAKEIIKASKNVSNLLQKNANDLYLQLRVQL